jgi:hypothetical protein
MRNAGKTEVVLSVLRERGSRTRHKSLESPVPGKRARRVRREAARKRPAFLRDTDLAVQPTLPGVTTCQGGRESRPQGEVAQVIRALEDWEGCEMQNAETVLSVLRVITGEPDAQKVCAV